MVKPFAVLNMLFSVRKIALSPGHAKDINEMLQHSTACLRVVNTVEMLPTGFSKGCKHPSSILIFMEVMHANTLFFNIQAINSFKKLPKGLLSVIILNGEKKQ